MLSLLIISNNPKAKLIQDFIQPLVKTDISLVADFELGLSEVFEKNPATVIIQEQIDGVACDAIALYIKQMFGNDAPTFIMVHEGNTRIKPVKGLYDFIVNLNQSNETLVAEVSTVLKRIIGGEQVENADLPQSPLLPEESANVPVEVHLAADTPAEVLSPEPPEPARQKLSVLLVENNIIDQRVALTMLSNLGCAVDIVSDGQKAIHALELINYDVVFMNLVLPRMDGLVTTSMIRDKRSQVLNHDVLIIALTSGTKPGDHEKCLDAGMNAYLEKPVNKAYLAEAIEKWVRTPFMDDSDDTFAAEVFPPEEVAKRPLKKKTSRTAKAMNAAELDITEREQLEQSRRRIENLERIVTEKMSEVEAAKEQLHTERVARIEVEEELRQARINNDALNEQLQSEFGKRIKIEEAFDQAQASKDVANELFQAEFTLRTDAEETLSLVRTAAEAADREAETVINQLQGERDTWKQLESSLKLTDSERTLELQTANELLQAERAARNVAEKKLDQAIIAAETLNKQVEFVNEYLETERAERKMVEIRLKEVEELLARLIADMQSTPAGTVSESLAAMVDRHKDSTYHPATSPTWTDDNPFDTVSTSRSRFSVFLFTALFVLCIAGGWYLLNSKPQSSVRADQPKTAAPAGTPTPVAEKPIVPKQLASPAADSSVPSFVTVSGRDSIYSAENPGWERYVDTKHDIRIYREAGRLKAIQVLAAKGQVILDSFMRTVLHEMAGNSDYKRLSSETKMGFMIQRNSVGSDSRLIVYRKLPSNKIRAFVVQFE